MDLLKKGNERGNSPAKAPAYIMDDSSSLTSTPSSILSLKNEIKAAKQAVKEQIRKGKVKLNSLLRPSASYEWGYGKTCLVTKKGGKHRLNGNLMKYKHSYQTARFLNPNRRERRLLRGITQPVGED